MYGDKLLFEALSFGISKNDRVALVAQNGTGKTSLLNIIAGLDEPDSGKVVTRNGLTIGYLPQEASVFRKLSVADNIRAVLELRKELSQQQRIDKLDALLEELQIEHLRDSLGISLSGGERRRVEIARALATEPSFILLDEPFAGVDPISVLDIQRIITHLVDNNIGVLITDHNVRETLGICSRGYILHDGHMMAEGEPEALLHDPDVKRFYLGENFTL
jgi:lipopolysaccharide export system ATP-binding protein